MQQQVASLNWFNFFPFNPFIFYHTHHCLQNQTKVFTDILFSPKHVNNKKIIRNRLSSILLILSIHLMQPELSDIGISYHFLGVHVAGEYDFHCHSTKQHWLRKYPNDWGCNKRIRSNQLFSQFLSLLCYQWRNSSIIDQKF